MSTVCIIGGGVSGLSAGIYALRNGHKVKIIEKYAIAGGNLTAWKRKGYTIDTCIHWLTGSNSKNVMNTMWRDLGALDENIPLHKPEFLFTVEHEGSSLSLYRDLNRTVEALMGYASSYREKKEIRDFKKVVEFMESMTYAAGPEHNEKLSFSELLVRSPQALKYYTHSTGQIAKRFKTPVLRLFFNSLMGNDFNAIDFAFVVATFVSENADIPAGLSKPMAERMRDKFLSLGGEILYNKTITGAEINNGKVISVTDDTDNYEADFFLFAMDPKVSCDILGCSLPKELKKQFDNPKYKYFSSYHIEFAVDAECLPFKENLFIEVPENLQNSVGNRRITLRSFDFEPSFSPEGHSNMQAMVYCNEAEISKFLYFYKKDKSAYRLYKEGKANAVKKCIEARFPELKDKLEILDIWTPATFNRYTGSHMGTYQGFINPKNKYPRKLSGKIPGITNALLCSQWQMSPGGLPVAASRGRAAVMEMDGYNS